MFRRQTRRPRWNSVSGCCSRTLLIGLRASGFRLSGTQGSNAHFKPAWGERTLSAAARIYLMILSFARTTPNARRFTQLLDPPAAAVTAGS